MSPAPDGARPDVLLRPVRPDDLDWVVARHGELYEQEYGWDARFETLVADVVAAFAAEHDPAREAAWVAELDGRRAGCVFCVARDDTTAQLRLLLVEPFARGLGIGSRLVDECLRFARGAGYDAIILWTNDVLVSARRIYEAAGFELIEEEPHDDFGRDLVGQYWHLDLVATPTAGSRRPSTRADGAVSAYDRPAPTVEDHVVNPVPEHLHTVTPHIVCTPCADAIVFYEHVFGAERVGDVMEGPDGSIGHAEIRIGDSVVMLADEWPDGPTRSPTSLGGSTGALFIYTDDVDSLWERAVEAGCEVVYPLEVQFYGDKGGRLRDPFGHTWGLGQHVEDVSDEEMQRRVAAFYEDAAGEG